MQWPFPLWYCSPSVCAAGPSVLHSWHSCSSLLLFSWKTIDKISALRLSLPENNSSKSFLHALPGPAWQGTLPLHYHPDVVSWKFTNWTHHVCIWWGEDMNYLQQTNLWLQASLSQEYNPRSYALPPQCRFLSPSHVGALSQYSCLLQATFLQCIPSSH